MSPQDLRAALSTERDMLRSLGGTLFDEVKALMTAGAPKELVAQRLAILSHVEGASSALSMALREAGADER